MFQTISRMSSLVACHKMRREGEKLLTGIEVALDYKSNLLREIYFTKSETMKRHFILKLMIITIE